MFSNKDLRKLIFPLVIEQALVMMVGIMDTVMVSYVGEAAISGVALVDMINYLIIVVLSAIDTGGAVIVSQYLGRKDKKNAGRCASQLLLVTVLLSIAIMGICLVFHTMILELLFGAIDADVKKAAVTYFLITALSFPFLGIYNSSAAIFRSMQKINHHVCICSNQCDQYSRGCHWDFCFACRSGRCGSTYAGLQDGRCGDYACYVL